MERLYTRLASVGLHHTNCPPSYQSSSIIPTILQHTSHPPHALFRLRDFCSHTHAICFCHTVSNHDRGRNSLGNEASYLQNSMQFTYRFENSGGVQHAIQMAYLSCLHIKHQVNNSPAIPCKDIHSHPLTYSAQPIAVENMVYYH